MDKADRLKQNKVKSSCITCADQTIRIGHYCSINIIKYKDIIIKCDIFNNVVFISVYNNLKVTCIEHPYFLMALYRLLASPSTAILSNIRGIILALQYAVWMLRMNQLCAINTASLKNVNELKR